MTAEHRLHQESQMSSEHQLHREHHMISISEAVAHQQEHRTSKRVPTTGQQQQHDSVHSEDPLHITNTCLKKLILVLLPVKDSIKGWDTDPVQ